MVIPIVKFIKDRVQASWIYKQATQHWVFEDIDFGDPRIEQMYQEHRLKTIRNNWKFILLLLQIIFVALSGVFWFGDKSTSNLKKLIPPLMFLLLFVFKHYINTNKLVARYGAVLFILCFGILMTNINLEFTQFRLYEGFLFHISVSFLLSTWLISDWKISSATIAMVYFNLYAMLRVKFEDAPLSLLHGLISSMAIFWFNAFLISRTFKQEFYSTHKAKQASSQLRRVLQSLPEGVAIMDESGKNLKFINKKLQKTFDFSSFYESKKENMELVKFKKSIDKSLKKIYRNVAICKLEPGDSLILKNCVLSNFVANITKDIIEEGKGMDPDIQIQGYEQIPLAEFLQNQRELWRNGNHNETSTKISISIDKKHFPTNEEYKSRDFIIKTSKIDGINNDNKDPTFLQMFTDTTQITQLEEVKAQSNYQRQMLSNVSHEFRTPLNAMSLSLHLMKDHVNESWAKYHQISSSSWDILKSLVEDILDFSKIEAGVFEIQEQEFTFNQLFSEVSSIFEIQTRMKGILLDFQMETVFEELKVKSDKERIKQILLNLVSNALKFTDHGSINISLRIHEIKNFICEGLGQNDTGNISNSELMEEMPVCNLLFGTNNYNFQPKLSKFGMKTGVLNQDTMQQQILHEEVQEMLPSKFNKDLKVELSVTDTGIGIPERDLPSLFKLFGKTSSNHNRNKTGTGLGLTICKKLWEKLGGKIELNSKEEIGTKVTCTFICRY